MKHVSKFCHVNPTISSKVMVIGVLLAYLGTADNGRKPPIKMYGNVWECLLISVPKGYAPTYAPLGGTPRAISSECG